jgi:hypothetical protein
MLDLIIKEACTLNSEDRPTQGGMTQGHERPPHRGHWVTVLAGQPLHIEFMVLWHRDQGIIVPACIASQSISVCMPYQRPLNTALSIKWVGMNTSNGYASISSTRYK